MADGNGSDRIPPIGDPERLFHPWDGRWMEAEEERPEALIHRGEQDQHRREGRVDVPVRDGPPRFVPVLPFLVLLRIAVEVDVLAGEWDDDDGSGPDALQHGFVRGRRLPEPRRLIGAFQEEELEALRVAGGRRALAVSEDPFHDRRIDLPALERPHHLAAPEDVAELHRRYQRSLGCRAALASSRRRTGVVSGASWRRSGCSSASFAAWSMASAKASRVSFDSVSVGSTIMASSTMSGKYTVEGWNPRSMRRLAMSMARTPYLRNDLAVATNSCMGWPGKASG